VSGVNFKVYPEGIGIITINRPKVRNALNWAAMRAFAAAVEDAHLTSELSALILTGSGNTFVSGGDLSELQHYPLQKDGLRLATIMGDALKRLEELACPTIAAINGPARGGGAEMAVACDLRLFSEDADIGFVHTRLGIITAWGGGQRLMNIVGYSKALELITSARVISAKDALILGLASKLTPIGQVVSEAWKLALQIASNPPMAVRAAKKVLRNGLDQNRDQALAAERAEFPALWDSDFRKRAVKRFLSRSKSKKVLSRQSKTLIKQS
jgi:enoyl-CoA hydratase